MKLTLLVVALVASAAPSAMAQEPIRVGTRVGTLVTPPGVGGYDDGARRDPFVSLITPKRNAAQARPIGGGLKALAVSEVKVTGIQNFGTRTAMLEGPDGKTYVARAKDKLFDGVVKSIEADCVVFIEQLADAMGTLHAREVRKLVRSGGEEQ